MAMIPINNVGSIGLITDRKPHELPLNAWSSAFNVRFVDDYAEKFLGESLFAAATVAPYFTMPVADSPDYYWLYAGLNKVYIYDGSNSTNITRQTLGADVDYAATALRNWTGGAFNGVPFINNGVDVPQIWLPTTLATKLVMLTNWDANWTCGALRTYKNFMVAVDVTKSGTRYSQMVKWSHPADAGGVPSSWDATDATKDAGEYMLAETPGDVIDSVQLRDINVIYKEDAIYLMQYIGGVYVFRFSALSKILGLLSRRCAVEFTPGQHAAFCVGDIVRHDSQQVRSIIDGKTRKWVFDNLDPTNYQTSFVVNHAKKSEVWFCFPTTGNTLPNRALVWNWVSDTVTVRQLADAAHISPGLRATAIVPWDSATGTWDTQTALWDTRRYNPTELSLVQARPSASALAQLEITNQLTGTTMTSYLERTGIAVPLVADRSPDFSSFKFCSALWPRIEGTDGGQIAVSVGVQQKVDGAVEWSTPVQYTIGTTDKVDCRVAGRLLAVRFESTSDIEWRIHGYELEIQKGGRF